MELSIECVTTATATAAAAHSLRFAHRTLHFIFPFNSVRFSPLTPLSTHCSVEYLLVRLLVYLLLLARSLALLSLQHKCTNEQTHTHTMNERERRAHTHTHTQCLLVKTIFMTSAHSINVLHLPFSCSMCSLCVTLDFCLYVCVDVLICLSKWKGKICCCCVAAAQPLLVLPAVFGYLYSSCVYTCRCENLK